MQQSTIVIHALIYLFTIHTFLCTSGYGQIPSSTSTVVDGFETGDFSALPWEHEGTAWQITDVNAYSGIYSARSGAISDSEATTLSLTYECAAGQLFFAVKVSSEDKYDVLTFYIDDQEMDSWSGEEDWQEASYQITAGKHTFTWTYEKDKSKPDGQDAAWIDAVSFPIPTDVLGDDFETGDFSKLPWEHQETPWVVTDINAYTGTYCARSGIIQDSESSILSLAHDGQAGEIHFAVRVSCEEKFDKLIFRIDNEDVNSWSGEVPWTEVVYAISPGTHTYSWSYEKDKSDSKGQDAAWIDDVFIGDPCVVSLLFVDIPGGTFEMGDHHNVGEDWERPVHTVTLDSFRISRYETTNAQYAKFLNTALAEDLIQVEGVWVFSVPDKWGDIYPYLKLSESQIDFKDGLFTVQEREGADQANHPVVSVNWYGAKAFCEYYGYRLPTEAEWEYAARGGFYGPYYQYPWGSNESSCTQANFAKDPNGAWCPYPLNLTKYPLTSPVGHYGPQGTYGLCDMAGNVWEWCQDGYSADYYEKSPEHNPQGITWNPQDRVQRGGSWDDPYTKCRVFTRFPVGPQSTYNTLGFRACMSARPTGD